MVLSVSHKQYQKLSFSISGTYISYKDGVLGFKHSNQYCPAQTLAQLTCLECRRCMPSLGVPPPLCERGCEPALQHAIAEINVLVN
eukprot:6193913-Pleurochrysis_carterae.AAC.3